jgi:cation transport ATPase
LRIAKRTTGVAKDNLSFTAVYIALGIMLTAFGILSPIFTAASQSFPGLGIISNLARLLRRDGTAQSVDQRTGETPMLDAQQMLSS